jgi:hypothetical protein
VSSGRRMISLDDIFEHLAEVIQERDKAWADLHNAMTDGHVLRQRGYVLERKLEVGRKVLQRLIDESGAIAINDVVTKALKEME